MINQIKTLLLVIFSIVLSIGVAQIELPLRTGKMKDVFQLTDTLAKVTKSKLVKIDSAYDRKELIGFKLANQADTVTVLFIHQNEGGNSDLEISGTMMYSFYQVQGKYLSLFPIWKKYFNTSADVNTSMQGDYARNYKSKYDGWYSQVRLIKQRDFWVIK